MAKLPSLNEEDRANLVAYLDGELNTEAARAMEAKLHLDPRARAEAEALRRTWDILDYLPRPEPSTAFASRTLERVSPTRSVSTASRLPPGWWQPWSLLLGWVAAVLMAGTVGLAGVSFVSNRNPPPAVAASSAPAPGNLAADFDRLLVRDLRVIENKRLYDFVDDTSFLSLLDGPDLFGDDN